MTRSLADQRRKVAFALQVAENFSLLGMGLDLDWNGRFSWPKESPSSAQPTDPDDEYLLAYETTIDALLGVLREVKADLSNRNAKALATQVAMQSMSLRAHRRAHSDRKEFSRSLRPAVKAARDLQRALDSMPSQARFGLWQSFGNIDVAPCSKAEKEERSRRIFEHLNGDLRHFVAMADTAAGLIQKEKTRYSPFECEFVWAAAAYWREWTGKNPTITRNAHKAGEWRSPFHRLVVSGAGAPEIPADLIRDIVAVFGSDNTERPRRASRRQSAASEGGVAHQKIG
jgi:hypothetical protein